jgi:hypothetical protein
MSQATGADGDLASVVKSRRRQGVGAERVWGYAECGIDVVEQDR